MDESRLTQRARTRSPTARVKSSQPCPFWPTAERHRSIAMSPHQRPGPVELRVWCFTPPIMRIIWLDSSFTRIFRLHRCGATDTGKGIAGRAKLSAPRLISSVTLRRRGSFAFFPQGWLRPAGIRVPVCRVSKGCRSRAQCPSWLGYRYPRWALY